MSSRLATALALLALASAPVAAAELSVSVKRPDGTPVAQAVVLVDAVPAKRSGKPAGEAKVDQVDRQFAPHVAVVRTGAMVRFPNRDDIRHHVYSFSPAKTFELPLYKGTPADPVKFDKPGVVTLACNIHDWMIGYVYVTDAEWFDVTAADGGARITVGDHDRYQVTVWHPDLGPDTPGQVLPLAREGRAALEAKVVIEPGKARDARRLRRGSDRYR